MNVLCFVNEFLKNKRRSNPNILLNKDVIIHNYKRLFIPTNDYIEMKITIIVRWNERTVRFRKITQRHSEVYAGTFMHSRFPTYLLVFIINLPISHVCWLFVGMYNDVWGPPQYPLYMTVSGHRSIPYIRQLVAGLHN